MSHVTCQVTRVMCHVSYITFHVSCVACHLSITPTASATDPPPANSPNMHSRLVPKDPKTLKKFKTQKIIKTAKTRKCLGYANISDALFDQKFPIYREAGFPRWHTQTHRQLTVIAT